ncbi:hypothetical protein KIN20_003331 [Parelaphostrongylus tenuis]|uniref:Uncharacterized protein n=1 Tax=Parelaphostrongylus tenuis TaxID=148309 RepID=A0AAD5QHC9_PARTN|nr:hypothetical protein KIN20_003331 [Parelaphostrongylus tenuis]
MAYSEPARFSLTSSFCELAWDQYSLKCSQSTIVSFAQEAILGEKKGELVRMPVNNEL